MPPGWQRSPGWPVSSWSTFSSARRPQATSLFWSGYGISDMEERCLLEGLGAWLPVLRYEGGDSRMVVLRDCGICATPPIGEPSAGIICGRFSAVSGPAAEGWTGGDSPSNGWCPSWRARVVKDYCGTLRPSAARAVE